MPLAISNRRNRKSAVSTSAVFLGATYLWEWFTELPRVLCLLIEKSFEMCLASSQLCNKFNQIGLLSLNLNALGLLLTLFVCNLADGYSVI